MIFTGFYNSPFGTLKISVENDALKSLNLFVGKIHDFKDIPLITEIKFQLDEYFEGKRKYFDIKINPEGTEFQKKVWKQMLKIPYGKSASYSDIAISIGHKNAQRAVGNACNKNPILIIVPCHRVTGENNIGGFVLGTEAKKFLLNLEMSN